MIDKFKLDRIIKLWYFLKLFNMKDFQSTYFKLYIKSYINKFVFKKNNL